jgi:hypothetical protein
MRRLLVGCCLFLSCISAQAQQSESIASVRQVTPELADAYREYALARQQLILYRQVTLPLKRQMLADAAQLAKLQVAVLDRRLADYRPFLAVGEYSPLRTAAENDLVAREHIAQRLRQFRDEELALMRFAGESDELYQYDVLRAALRVRAAHAVLGQ